MAKIRAAVAGVSYLVIISLAAYNLRGQLFGTNIPSASASSAPVTSQAVTTEAAAPSSSNSQTSGSSSAQSAANTPEPPAMQSAPTSEKSNNANKPAQDKASALTHSQQSSIPVAGNGSVTVGQRLPEFFFMGLNGNTMTESTLRGHKTLFIIVSPTCPHCQKELKLLHQIENDYPSIEPVFASVFPLEETRPLADMTGEGDHIYSGARELAQNLGIKGVPFLMLIDEKGVIRAIRTGELEEPVFRDILGRFARGETLPQASNKTPFSIRSVRGEQA